MASDTKASAQTFRCSSAFETAFGRSSRSTSSRRRALGVRWTSRPSRRSCLRPKSSSHEPKRRRNSTPGKKPRKPRRDTGMSDLPLPTFKSSAEVKGSGAFRPLARDREGAWPTAAGPRWWSSWRFSSLLPPHRRDRRRRRRPDGCASGILRTGTRWSVRCVVRVSGCKAPSAVSSSATSRTPTAAACKRAWTRSASPRRATSASSSSMTDSGRAAACGAASSLPPPPAAGWCERAARASPSFQGRSPRRPRAVLLHEVLHTLGLGENPPTSAHITQRVVERCYPERVASVFAKARGRKTPALLP